LLTRGVSLIVEPHGLKMSLDDFLSSYGGYLEDLVAVAKDTTGHSYYPSKVAPADEENATFFTDLAEASKEVGIRLAAYVNVFADAFFASDPNFKTYSSGGETSQVMVCPNNQEFHDHMSSVIKEVAQYPIHTLFLASLGYANADFCYCDRCRSEFTDYADLRFELDSSELESNPDLRKRWIDWRVSKITELVRNLITKAKDVKPDLIVIPTFPLGPESGYASGAREHFGLDLPAIAKAAGHLAIEVFPWTPILPDPGSDEYNEYVTNLSFVEELSEDVKFVMTHWVIENEDEYRRAQAIAQATGINKIYSMLDYPAEYRLIRESRLGLGH